MDRGAWGGRFWIGLAAAVLLAACGSDTKPAPSRSASSLQEAASKVSPASELKQLDGTPMQGIPAGLKPLSGDPPEAADPLHDDAKLPGGLKAMTGTERHELPSGLKAFPDPGAEEATPADVEAETPP